MRNDDTKVRNQHWVPVWYVEKLIRYRNTVAIHWTDGYGEKSSNTSRRGIEKARKRNTHRVPDLLNHIGVVQVAEQQPVVDHVDVSINLKKSRDGAATPLVLVSFCFSANFLCCYNVCCVSVITIAPPKNWPWLLWQNLKIYLLRYESRPFNNAELSSINYSWQSLHLQLGNSSRHHWKEWEKKRRGHLAMAA